MAEDVMTIREMCEAFDVTPRTLRFYESKELLAPRREGNRRLYGRRDRARLKLILRGKRFGFSLEDIRQLLDIYDTDGGQHEQLQRAYEAACHRLNDMERQRDELIETINDLKQQLEWGRKVLQSFPHSKAAE